MITSRSDSLSLLQDHIGVSIDTFASLFVASVSIRFTDKEVSALSFFNDPLSVLDEPEGVVSVVTSSISFFAGFAFTASAD